MVVECSLMCIPFPRKYLKYHLVSLSGFSSIVCACWLELSCKGRERVCVSESVCECVCV